MQLNDYQLVIINFFGYTYSVPAEQKQINKQINKQKREPAN